jgi:transcriptional regulator with XRE-family HTH domain
MLRKKKGYTQAWMAETLEMSRSNYGGYELDRIQPPSEALNKIAALLDTTMDFLIGNTDISVKADAEDRFIDSLDLADEAIMEKFNLTLDGQTLTPDQMKTMITVLRALKQQK